MKPVLAEILKLRGSTSWAVVVLLPVASVVSACIFVRPDSWRLLWIRSVGFYGMALLPSGWRCWPPSCGAWSTGALTGTSS